MNILWDGVIQGEIPNGGVSRYCADAINALSNKAGNQILTICPPGAPSFAAKGPHLRQISQLPISKVNRFRIKSFKPDIFQSCYYGPSLTPGCPVVQIAYDFIDARYPLFMPNKPEFIEHQKHTLETADAVVAISESTRQDILKFTTVDSEKIHLIYPTVSTAFSARPRPSLPPLSKPYWLWVGQGRGYKNRLTFLRAFALTAKEMDMDLILVGGPHSKLSDLELDILLTHKILDRVHHLHVVSDDTLRSLYASANAFVQSSLWEGFGIPIIEALSCGTRVVISDIPVFREVAGNHATYADPYSVDDWQKALLSTGVDSLSEQSKQTQIAQVQKQFQSEPLLEKWLNVYKRL